MPSSPFKNIIKTINTDKNFNVESFLSNEFGSLWGLFYDYIQKLATTPTKDSLFKRNKFSDLKGIYNALQKILPETKGFHYKDEFLFLINKVFANFFHPDTSAPIRTQMMEFFFTIISKLPQEKIDILSGALNLIVPYSRFSSTDNGVKKMKSYLIETIQPVPIIDPSAPAGTQDDCITDLKRFLQFIKENWTNSSINTIRIINEYVLDVIFKGVLPEYVSSPNSQGFSSLPPYNIYHTVLEFFSSIITSMFNFTDFLSYGRNSRLMLGIVGLSENYKSNIDYLTAIEILTNIYTSNNYIEIIQSDESGNFFYEICTVYIKIVSSVLNEMKPESNLTATDKFIQISYLFISNYISSTTMSLGDNKAIEIIYKLFLDNTKYMKSLALILILILNHFISNQNWSEAIWSKLSYLVVSNDTLSAMAAHYAQYLAVYSFPYEFEINFEKAKGVCMNHQRRKQRTKQATPHDFIAENIEQIVKFPADFVHQNIKAYYEPFSKYDDLISKIPIVPLTFQDKEIIRSIIISFLDIFSKYNNYESTNQQENCFAINISFCQMLSKLRYIPNDIHFNRAAAYSLCSRRLFNAILSQNNIHIRKMAFTILSDLINLIEIEQYLTNIDYSNWYASLIIMMLSKFEECRTMGFNSSVLTIQKSFEGSSMLINIMLNLCEEKLIPINESYISFISSIPLFQVTSTFPNNYIKSIINLINSEKNNYINNYENIFNGVNSRERCIKLIMQLQFTNNWSLILPAYSVLIADEFSQPQQNPNVFINILNYLLEALFNESFEAILTIRSMLMYSDSLSELIPKEFLSFIEKISEFTTKIDEKDITKESFHFYLIQLVAYLYIYNYKITHTSNSYQQFAEFLISAKKKSFSNNIINLINNLISLLSIYYGGYPFPQTNSFPTHIQPTVNKNSNNVKPELFSTLETVIHPYYNDNNEVEVAFQGNSGNFVWKFKEIDDLLYQEQEQLTINIPITDDKDYTLIQSDEEKEYVNVFNQLLEDYKQEFDDQSFEMDIFPLDNEQLNANIQQIESFENIINNQNDNKISFPYPVIGATSPLAGALTACGRYPLGHPENFQRVDSQYIDNIEKIQKQNHRLGIKIGVVFIGPNVDNQNQILATTFEETSPHFREFVTGLGWPIELKSHVGYDGGLDLQRNGKTSIYYANFTDEIMFHIAPLLPTDPKDDQQIYKKRHIGNDHIHIVWCEQGRDYDITTITSQFNQAHIVIYPLQTGLFHVDIHWRKDLGWFGPLRYSIVVNKTVLPSLIRETAVSAMKSFYYSQEVTKYASPQNEIAKTLLTVIPKTDKKKEKKDATDKGVMESLEMLMRIAQPIQ